MSSLTKIKDTAEFVAQETKTIDRSQLRERAFTVTRFPDGRVTESKKESELNMNVAKVERYMRTTYERCFTKKDQCVKRALNSFGARQLFADRPEMLREMYQSQIARMTDSTRPADIVALLREPIATALKTHGQAKAIGKLIYHDAIPAKLLARSVPSCAKWHEAPELLEIGEYLEGEGQPVHGRTTGMLECTFNVAAPDEKPIELHCHVDEYIIRSIPAYRSKVEFAFQYKFLARLEEDVDDEIDFVVDSEEQQQTPADVEFDGGVKLIMPPEEHLLA